MRATVNEERLARLFKEVSTAGVPIAEASDE